LITPAALTPSTGQVGAKNGSEDESKGLFMNRIPHEFAIGGVFLPPLLIASLLGVVAALVTARLLNRYRLSKYFYHPPLVFLALMVIYTVFFGTFVIRG
jgi:hypothetical protein